MCRLESRVGGGAAKSLGVTCKQTGSWTATHSDDRDAFGQVSISVNPLSCKRVHFCTLPEAVCRGPLSSVKL